MTGRREEEIRRVRAELADRLEDLRAAAEALAAALTEPEPGPEIEPETAPEGGLP